MILLYILLAFLSGSLPFSVWIGRRALGTDPRTVGDGNPGATNVASVGGPAWGALALVLDVLKAAIPVSVATFVLGIPGRGLIPIALAPVAGHAFSPFLRGRGGKALAATFGTWMGLTVGEGPIILGLFCALWLSLLNVDGWAVLLGMLGLIAHLLRNHPDPVLLAVAAANTLLLAFTHRADLATRPGLRPWLRNRLNKRS